jgi:uncharacterized protein YwgA
MKQDAEHSETPLRLETSLDLTLALLYAPGKTGKFGEPIEGITRLQKLLFLLQQGKGPRALVAQAKQYAYQPYKMGPYSPGVREDLEILLSAGLIRTEKLEYLLTDDTDAEVVRAQRVESQRFILTDAGSQAGKDLWSGMAASEREGYRA